MLEKYLTQSKMHGIVGLNMAKKLDLALERKHVTKVKKMTL